MIHLSLNDPAGISCWSRNPPHCSVWSSALPGCPVAGSWKTLGWQTSRWKPSSPPCYHSRSSCELRGGRRQNSQSRFAWWESKGERRREIISVHSLGPVKEIQRSVMGSSFDVSMPFPPNSCTKSPDSAQPSMDLCGEQHVVKGVSGVAFMHSFIKYLMIKLWNWDGMPQIACSDTSLFCNISFSF